MSDASAAESKAASEKDPKTAASAVKVTAPRVVKPLAEMDFGERGIKQNTWYAIAENGVTPDDVLTKEYWAHVAAKSLRPFDKIHIMNRERTWYGELVVFAWYGNGAVVRWIAPPVQAEKSSIPAADSGFEIFDGGLGKDWSVRRPDGRVMMEGYKDLQSAQAALLTWLKAQGRRAA